MSLKLFESFDFVMYSMNRMRQIPNVENIQCKMRQMRKREITLSDIGFMAGVVPKLYRIRMEYTENIGFSMTKNAAEDKVSEKQYVYYVERLVAEKLEEFKERSLYYRKQLEIWEMKNVDVKDFIKGVLPVPKVLQVECPLKMHARESKKRKVMRDVVEEKKEMEICSVPKKNGLEGLPDDLVHKVRMKEFRRKRTKVNGMEHRDKIVRSTLVKVCSQLEAHAKFTKKKRFLIHALKEQLRHAPSKDCLEEQIHLIAKHAPDWATVKTTSKGEVLCIQPKAKFNQAVLQLKAYVASANTANGPFQ